MVEASAAGLVWYFQNTIDWRRRHGVTRPSERCVWGVRWSHVAISRRPEKAGGYNAINALDARLKWVPGSFPLDGVGDSEKG